MHAPVAAMLTIELMQDKYLQCKTKIERKHFEQEHGMRFSVLLDLPYFDIIATCGIDPMYNLFLGTSKHMMEVWQKANIINANDLAAIQDKVSTIRCWENSSINIIQL